MLNQFQPSEQAVEAANYSELPVELRKDPRIDNFLDRIYIRLIAGLPYDERLARRAEMQAHIEDSAAAHMEMGSTREEALALAFAQVQREHAEASQAVTQQTRTVHQHSARPATRIALALFGLFYLLDQTRIAGHLWSRCIAPLYAEDGTILREAPALAGFYRFELLVLPVLCGLAVGLLAKHRPVRGTLNALALLAIPAIAMGGIAYGLSYAELLPQVPWWLGWSAYLIPNPIPAVCGVGIWAMLGALSAAAGNRLRRRMPRAVNTARRLGKSGRRLLRRPAWAVRRPKNAGGQTLPR